MLVQFVYRVINLKNIMDDDLILNLVFSDVSANVTDNEPEILEKKDNEIVTLNKDDSSEDEGFPEEPENDIKVTVDSSKKDFGFKTVMGKSLAAKPKLNFEKPVELVSELDFKESGINRYHSQTSFTNLDLFPRLIELITEKLKFEKLTKVQEKAIPALLDGKDALIMSETGSGKTLAYAAPVIHSLHEALPPVTRSDGPIALVFAPTRELALQSYEVFHSLTQCAVRIVSTCLMGGQKRKSEKARIRKGINIMISTPGRFVDHLENTACLDLQNVRWLVFDEADRLLDMGFQNQINHILTAVKERSDYTQQVVLLSATLSPGVEKLVSLSLKNPIRIEMKPRNKKSDFAFIECQTGLRLEKASLPDSLTQYVTLVPSKLRLVALVAFINMHCFQQSEKLLVFLSCRDSVVFHHNILRIVEVSEYNPNNCPNSVFQLHGGMTQQQRTEVLHNFKKVTSGVILCTDVAARGLDIPNVNWVMQYDSPGSPVNYIHRVGRTARAGNQGNALLFLTPAESAYINLLTAFDIAVKEIEVDTVLTEVLDYKYKKLVLSLKLQKAREVSGHVHKQLENCVLDDEKMRECAEKAYVSFIRAYATYPASLKKVFHVRALHLGHVAKSFALKETPSEISSSFKRNKDYTDDSTTKKRRFDNDRRVPGVKQVSKLQPKLDLISEFSSGLKPAF